MNRVHDFEQALLKDPAYAHEFTGLMSTVKGRYAVSAPAGAAGTAKRLKPAREGARRLSESLPA